MGSQWRRLSLFQKRDDTLANTNEAEQSPKQLKNPSCCNPHLHNARNYWICARSQEHFQQAGLVWLQYNRQCVSQQSHLLHLYHLIQQPMLWHCFCEMGGLQSFLSLKLCSLTPEPLQPFWRGGWCRLESSQRQSQPASIAADGALRPQSRRMSLAFLRASIRLQSLCGPSAGRNL